MISIVMRGSPELPPSHGGRTPASCANVDRKPANRVLAAARSAATTMRALQTFCAALLRTWRARQDERAFLESVPDFQLPEMGLSREDRRREVNKPFWRA